MCTVPPTQPACRGNRAFDVQRRRHEVDRAARAAASGALLVVAVVAAAARAALPPLPPAACCARSPFHLLLYEVRGLPCTVMR